MTAEQDTAVVAGEALDERALADLIQAHTSLSRAIHTAYHTLIISAPASNTHAIADLPKFFDSEERLRALWESNLGVKTIRPKQVQDIPELYMLAELLDRRDAYIKYAAQAAAATPAAPAALAAPAAPAASAPAAPAVPVQHHATRQVMQEKTWA